MAWHITGTDLGPCSCDIGCPCILGELEADRGWCSAVRLYDIHRGDIDGIDVSGMKVALVADWASGLISTGADKADGPWLGIQSTIC